LVIKKSTGLTDAEAGAEISLHHKNTTTKTTTKIRGTSNNNFFMT
jgi:hypothetical protein